LKICKTLSLMFLVLLSAAPVLGAVNIEGMTFQNGVNAIQNESAINTPLMKLLLLSVGAVFFLGLFAILKCGGASFLGMTVGTPYSAAAGFIGMISCLGMGLMMMAGIALYLSWM